MRRNHMKRRDETAFDETIKCSSRTSSPKSTNVNARRINRKYEVNMKRNTECKQEANDGKTGAHGVKTGLHCRLPAGTRVRPEVCQRNNFHFRLAVGHDGPRGPGAGAGHQRARCVQGTARGTHARGPSKRGEQPLDCFELMRADQHWHWQLICIESVAGRRSTGRSVKWDQRTERKPTKKGCTEAGERKKYKNNNDKKEMCKKGESESGKWSGIDTVERQLTENIMDRRRQNAQWEIRRVWMDRCELAGIAE